jgi:hypothetical protein
VSPSNDHDRGGFVERIPRSASAADGPSSPVAKSVLIRWMERLGVDQDEIANATLLLEYLQTHCLRCDRAEDCARAVDEVFDDGGWDSWYEYCPNADPLVTLGAIQNCGRAVQRLKAPIIISPD